MKYKSNFRHTIDAITDSSPETLADTEFRRVPLFYSLFAAAYHRLYGVPKIDLPTPARGRCSKEEIEGLQNSIATLSQTVQGAKEGNAVPTSEAAFVAACLSQTDNIRPRQIRMESIYKNAFA
jgi:hypothetical protein